MRILQLFVRVTGEIVEVFLYWVLSAMIVTKPAVLAHLVELTYQTASLGERPKS